MLRTIVVFAILSSCWWAVSVHAPADDWSQWMGDGRDNVWKETGLLDEFPDNGPGEIWSTNIAGGYAGPAVVGDRVYVTDYQTADNVKVANFERDEFSGMERVLCLDANSGELIWKHEYPVNYTISYPAGPRCTPIVDDGMVYTLGAEGHLNCLDATDGKVVWRKDLKVEFGTKAALWGYAGHPLIDGDRLITLAGGSGSHVVALNKKDGSEIWTALSSPEQGYSPPTIIEAGGVRQLILLRPNAVTSINPVNGQPYWSVPYEATSGSIIMSPVKVGDYLYAAGYSNKSLLLKLNSEKPDVEEVWRDKARDAISPVNVQPIAVGNVIYGFDQGGSLCAVEIPSGKRLWATSAPIGERPVRSGTAFIVKQADRFWLFNENGEIIIARMTREGYQEIDRAKVIEPSNLAFGRQVVWSMPAFANRRAYIRNDDEIICIDLSQ